MGQWSIRTLQALPANGKAITTWAIRDQAYVDVAQGVHSAVQGENPDGFKPTLGPLDPILEGVRQEFEKLLARVTEAMKQAKECKELPIPIFYAAKALAVKQVSDAKKIKAVNILRHKEWTYKNFSGAYLHTEGAEIALRNLRVERFFVGTMEQFETPEVRNLMKRNIEDDVIVRRVYVDKKVGGNPAFDRDIAFHETVPESCLTEGIYEGDYLTHGRITTKDAQIEAEQIFTTLEKYSPRHLVRSSERVNKMERSKKGWEEIYAQHSTSVQRQEVSPILSENNRLETLLRLVLKDNNDPDQASCNIVDAGCGNGISLAYCIDVCQGLHNEFNNARFDVTGIDFSRTAISLSTTNLINLERSKPPYVNGRVLLRDITEDIPAVTDTVDLLFCVNTFSHLHPDELVHALAEWRRVLRPGGRLLFNAYLPENESLQRCQDAARMGSPGCGSDNRATAWWYHDMLYKYYKEEEIGHLIDAAGFKINEITSMEWTEPSHDQHRPEEQQNRSLIIDASSRD